MSGASRRRVGPVLFVALVGGLISVIPLVAHAYGVPPVEHVTVARCSEDRWLCLPLEQGSDGLNVRIAPHGFGFIAASLAECVSSRAFHKETRPAAIDNYRRFSGWTVVERLSEAHAEIKIQVVDRRLSHVLNFEVDDRLSRVALGDQFGIKDDVGSQGAAFLVVSNRSLPSSEARRQSSGYQRAGENERVRLVVAIAAWMLAVLGLVWRGVWHGVVLIREGRPLYHNVVGLCLVLAGMAVLWTGMWLLLADGPDLANMAQVAVPPLRWEGGEL